MQAYPRINALVVFVSPAVLVCFVSTSVPISNPVLIPTFKRILLISMTWRCMIHNLHNAEFPVLMSFSCRVLCTGAKYYALLLTG